MKKLSSTLKLSKQSVQILDDKSLVNLRGGARGEAAEVTCNEDSCKVKSCGYLSC